MRRGDKLALLALAMGLGRPARAAEAPGEGETWRGLLDRWRRMRGALLDVLLGRFPPVPAVLEPGGLPGEAGAFAADAGVTHDQAAQSELQRQLGDRAPALRGGENGRAAVVQRHVGDAGEATDLRRR